MSLNSSPINSAINFATILKESEHGSSAWLIHCMKFKLVKYAPHAKVLSTFFQDDFRLSERYVQ